jgi:hypothetical protein
MLYGSYGMIESGQVCFVTQKFGVGSVGNTNFATVSVVEYRVMVQYCDTVFCDSDIYFYHVDTVFDSFF